MSLATNLGPRPLTFTGHGGIALAADCWGPQDGPLVLMLHGGGQNRHSWKTTGAGLAAAGAHVVSLDARGHGDSDRAPDGNYTSRAMIDDVLAVLDRLAAPAVVVGASMGGLTGLAAASEAGPSVIAGLVLVDVVPRIEPAGVERITKFMAGHRAGFDSLEDAADAVAQYLPHRRRPRTPDGLRRNLRQGTDGRWHWHWDPAFLDALEDPEVRVASLEAAAQNLQIPVLLLRGKLSDVVSAEGVRSFLELAPHTELIELSDAAHTAASDDNDAFTTAVHRFVLANSGLG